MSIEDFAHALSVRSDHSIGESTLQVETVVSKAKELGYRSVALVDTMSISALGQFSGECDKHGIKPIVGCTLRVVDDPLYRPPSKKSVEKPKDDNEVRIKVYVRTVEGLRSLMKLLSLGNTPDYFYYHSRVGWDDVMKLEGVAIATGDLFSLFHHPDWRNVIERLKTKFEVYAEFCPINTPLQYTLNKKVVEAVKKFHCKPLLS